MLKRPISPATHWSKMAVIFLLCQCTDNLMFQVVNGGEEFGPRVFNHYS